MTPMKRGAKAAGAAAKKARTEDPAEKRCGEAIRGLQECDLNKEAVKMLAAMLQTSLLERKDQRHRFQQHVVDMAGEALAAAEASMVAAIEQATREQALGEEQRAQLEASLKEAQDSVDAKASTLEQQKRALAEVAKSYQAAKKAVKQAELEKESRKVEVRGIEHKKEKLQATHTELIKPLVEGLEDPERRSDLVERLGKALGSLHFDASIVVALPNVFGKASSERGSFDAMVITNLHEEVERRIANCDAELSQVQAADAADEAAGVARARQVEETQQQQLLAVDKFTECQAAQQAAEAALKEAKKALKDKEKHVQRCEADQHRAERKVAAFREIPLAAFLELRDRGTEPEAPVVDAEDGQGEAEPVAAAGDEMVA